MKFIIAEITKNWYWKNQPVTNLLSQQFEKVINVNLERGYTLKEWKLNSFANEGILTETIIAIFEHVEEKQVPERISNGPEYKSPTTPI